MKVIILVALVFLPAISTSNACCDKLNFATTGSLATSEHSHILGIYNRVDTDSAGRGIYLQEGGIPSHLYHYSGLGEKAH